MQSFHRRYGSSELTQPARNVPISDAGRRREDDRRQKAAEPRQTYQGTIGRSDLKSVGSTLGCLLCRSFQLLILLSGRTTAFQCGMRSILEFTFVDPTQLPRNPAQQTV